MAVVKQNLYYYYYYYNESLIVYMGSDINHGE